MAGRKTEAGVTGDGVAILGRKQARFGLLGFFRDGRRDRAFARIAGQARPKCLGPESPARFD